MKDNRSSRDLLASEINATTDLIAHLLKSNKIGGDEWREMNAIADDLGIQEPLINHETGVANKQCLLCVVGIMIAADKFQQESRTAA